MSCCWIRLYQLSRARDYAKKKYKRAAIISVMLPFAQKLVDQYIQAVKKNPHTSSHKFARMYNDVNLMINRAIVRASISLVDGENAVVGMDDKTVNSISNDAIPKIKQGVSHGPSKEGNYPQKSVRARAFGGLYNWKRYNFVIKRLVIILLKSMDHTERARAALLCR